MPMSQYGDAALMAAFEKRVQEIVAKAIAAEREACAQLAEASIMTNDDNDPWDNAVRHVAYGIRARSDNSN